MLAACSIVCSIVASVASCLASGVRRVGSLAEMRRVQVACRLVVACGLVAARAHSSHVTAAVHVSGLRRSAVRAGAVERSLPLLRLRGGSEQLFIKTTSGKTETVDVEIRRPTRSPT